MRGFEQHQEQKKFRKYTSLPEKQDVEMLNGDKKEGEKSFDISSHLQFVQSGKDENAPKKQLVNTKKLNDNHITAGSNLLNNNEYYKI